MINTKQRSQIRDIEKLYRVDTVQEVLEERKKDFFISLIYEMMKKMGCGFNKEEVKKLINSSCSI